MDYAIGSRAGDYEILALLGAGGMGKVYKVRNIISDRVEAMKVLLPNLEGDPELADRFFREIKVQARLEHPNIAALYTALRLDNQLVMLMEYVEGVTLEGMLKHGPIPIEKAVDYIAQVLSALSYAHSHGIVHRDLKPSNMILTPKGVVKLMDFGIAKLGADRKLTQTGATVGSLFYMSPEQIKGATDLDARSDLYSLGVSLYEIVTGARPFQGDSEYSIMAAHLEKTPVPPIEIDSSLPPAVSEIVLMSIEKDPAKRFQSADAFRGALLNVGARPAATPPPPHVAAAPPPPFMPPPPTMPPPPSMPPPVAPARQAGHRGLYLALGSLVTIIVLVLAAMQLPKFWRTRAANPSETASVNATAPSETPAATTSAEPSTPLPMEAMQQPAEPLVQEPRAVNTQTRTQPAARRNEAAPDSNAAAEPVAQESQEPPPPRTAPAVAPTTAPANAAKIQEVREQLMLLGIRAGTVKTGLANLEREQRQQGLGLRADIAASSQRMEYLLDETEAALKRGDTGAAKKHLDAAERMVSKIESFLGH